MNQIRKNAAELAPSFVGTRKNRSGLPIEFGPVRQPNGTWFYVTRVRRKLNGVTTARFYQEVVTNQFGRVSGAVVHGWDLLP